MYDVSTPVCDTKLPDDVATDEYGKELSKINESIIQGGKSPKAICIEDLDCDNTVSGICEDGSKSPTSTSVQRLLRLRRDISSSTVPNLVSEFSLDESVELPTSSVLGGDSGYKFPSTFTPVKASKAIKIEPDNQASIQRDADGPCLNISDDETKNPILASSVRRVRNTPSDTADIRRSLKILGSSRCWTDRYTGDDSVGNCGLSDDDLYATQSPIRSLGSLIGTQSSASDFASMTPRSIDRNFTPLSTPRRSVGSTKRLLSREDSLRPKQPIHDTLDRFSDISILEICKLPTNPMVFVTLPKDIMANMKLDDNLEILYRHLKNMCTIIRRSSMRNGYPYFKIVQVLVQRVSRRMFNMDHLRQIAWAAPNLISIKWVTIGDSIRRDYVSEYNESRGDVVYDLHIRLLRPDGSNCANTEDYENLCFRFKTILYVWMAKWKMERDHLNDKTEISMPMVQLPEKPTNSAYSTPVRTPRLYMESPKPMLSKSSVRRLGLVDSLRTPVSSMRLFGNESIVNPDSAGSSSKRMRKMEIMSPVSTDLLDTPGMRRIKENAERLASIKVKSEVNQENDLKYWIDMRWFINILVAISIDDTNSSVMRLEFLVDFIVKYGSRKVTQEQVDRWTTTLSEIAPNLLSKKVSKFEDYSTILTINSSSSFAPALEYINRKINTLKS
ncbi:DNA replication factor CDT1 like family member protein [Theileria equi strain WA]|uniref:DNA replication factor CDT1 like family member protein n=1 Tax=Theileria equi strain WA TaxID=1537102 RepID=L0AUX1_THEEQ|nr:DNA replication factor CDT1 like family member protein [Theileria equi strain WA]XP_004829006.1 DNA replication factor CDT1 like family member protein [Theileria equi strain WA]AFZ79337.1 DNA replication factor CDT1 like family member protein [Theileria equi strain WA]AFZ79340.1 DNA replication factor CDT1 like family member protein [Theileria equi strain WA]|eukprot:XP_004829003.1 DNA replication factor CDT1 like family member protein [Theileria equi strain WA]